MSGSERRIAEKHARLVAVAVENGWSREDAEQFADDTRALSEMSGVADLAEVMVTYMRMQETVKRYEPEP